MKTIFLIILSVISFSVKAWERGYLVVQDTISVEEQIIPEVYPKLENSEADGTEKGFRKCVQDYFNKNLKNPENVSGRVHLKLRVNQDGKVSKIDIRTTEPSLESEALRLVEGLPVFTPAQIGGKSVDYVFYLPLTFRKFVDVFSEKTTYINTPDVFPKWQNYVANSISREAFFKDATRFFMDKVPYEEGKEGNVYLLLRVTAEGDVGVKELYYDNEKLGDEILKLSERLPKLVPAKNKGKNVAFEQVLVLKFSSEKKNTTTLLFNFQK